MAPARSRPVRQASTSRTGTSFPTAWEFPHRRVDRGRRGTSSPGLKLNGIYLFHGSNDLISGNLIGTGADGHSDHGNSGSGIVMKSGSGNTIGGTTPGKRNVIDWNQGNAVWLDIESNDVVEGNYIGVVITGDAEAGNGSGVYLYSTSSSTIGGVAAGSGNVISSNRGSGVTLERLRGLHQCHRGEPHRYRCHRHAGLRQRRKWRRHPGARLRQHDRRYVACRRERHFRQRPDRWRLYPERAPPTSSRATASAPSSAAKPALPNSNFGVGIEGGGNDTIGGLHLDAGFRGRQPDLRAIPSRA